MEDHIFTVSQFAKLHDIGKRTLHYYDEIGLFSPAVKNDENGYRYYRLSQSSLLEMILTLKNLGMSLEDIKTHMENRNSENLELLFIKQKELINNKISELKTMKKIIDSKLLQLELCKKAGNKIEIKHMPKKEYIVTKVESSENGYVDAMLEHGKKLTEQYLFDTELGTMISAKNLLSGEFNHSEYIFSGVYKMKGNYVRPEGDYLVAYHFGKFYDLTDFYKNILNYCRDNSLKPIGYSYEMGLNDISAMKIEEYVLIIELMVEKE